MLGSAAFVVGLASCAAGAHARGLAVVLDFVPNQVSREHPWFAAALKRDRLALDHFVVSDAEPKGWSVPWDPKDTRPVWTFDAALGRWYYHAFSPATPD